MRTHLTTTIATLALITSFGAGAVLAQEDASEADQVFPTSDALADEQNGVVEHHGDWEIRCTDGESNCRMFQSAFDTEGNEVANISMQALPEGSAAQLGVVVITPLLTLLPRGMTMGVDDGVPASYPYSWCDRAGCYSRFGLTAVQVDAMKGGDEAYLEIYAITSGDAAVRATISLTGFTAAFDALSAR